MAAAAVSPKFLEPIGHYAPAVVGVVAMSSGTATVDLSSKFHVLQGAQGSVVDAATLPWAPWSTGERGGCRHGCRGNRHF